MNIGEITERRLVRRFAVACQVFFLVLMMGCASTPPRQNVLITNTSPAAYFSLAGRLSVRVNDRLDVGNIKWSRTAGEERLGIYTPFGSQVAELVKTADGVRLRKGDEILTAATVGELTVALLGVALDIDQVAAWVQSVGLIADQPREMPLPDGSTWQVTASALRESGSHVFASRLSAIKEDTVIKLVVDEWRPL